MANNGEIKSKLNEHDVIDILEQISEQEGPKGPTVKYNRMRVFDSEDDDDDDQWWKLLWVQKNSNLVKKSNTNKILQKFFNKYLQQNNILPITKNTSIVNF